MRCKKLVRVTVVALGVCLANVTLARGDVFRGIASGLAQAGVTFQGQRNPLSGGADFQAIANFQGNPISFGLGDITLQGPISFEASVGRRVIPTMDFSLTTALNGNSQPVPLNYAFTLDVGSQMETITGSLLIDSDLSVNRLGFYDFNAFYSSRQMVTDRGRFSNNSQNFDSDLGPINIQGNILADALAFVTQPVFDATGGDNPFASFSSQGQLKRMLDAGEITPEQLAINESVLREIVANSLVSMFLMPSVLQDGSTGSPLAGRAVQSAAVPEPPVVLLMLAALPVMAVFLRRRTRSVS